MKDKKHQLELDLEEWCRDMWNAGLDDSHAEIKIAKRNTSNFRYVNDTALMAESKEKLKTSWWGWKRRVKKPGLKLNIKETKVMVSGPITTWQIDEGKMEIVPDFIFLSSKITVDGDCSLKIRHLLPGKKSYGKPTQHIKKQRQHFADKGPYSQSCVFPVVVYRCESWTIKKAEPWRIDAFELWCWRRLTRIAWIARST